MGAAAPLGLRLRSLEACGRSLGILDPEKSLPRRFPGDKIPITGEFVEGSSARPSASGPPKRGAFFLGDSGGRPDAGPVASINP